MNICEAQVWRKATEYRGERLDFEREFEQDRM